MRTFISSLVAKVSMVFVVNNVAFIFFNAFTIVLSLLGLALLLA